ncbi:MAG: hypothetical protein CL842_01120 [Crocinitomicaceae bacterium]|nr:hypothetical protein [Crocinitomicaceae bacterium]|tara:strand:+ start:103550 stop:104758 length:1209 start_codon:yes stop_codon:yes gene_type:complete
MKTTISVLIVTLFSNLLIARTTAIPDVNFEKALIALGYDSGTPNGTIPTANIRTIQQLQIDNKNIRSLIGIEDFSSLTLLNCYDNLLTSLDVTRNASLSILDCSNNQLTSIDVTGNRALDVFNCLDNKLVSLNVSNNNVLTHLDCRNNQLASIDVSINRALTGLIINDNNISNVDVSTNRALSLLGIAGNNISSIDVTKNTLLSKLRCQSNKIDSLDLTKNTLLTQLWCGANKIDSLDLTLNTKLIALSCAGNELVSLNVKNGNNANIWLFESHLNPTLTCIEVDDAAYSFSNWKYVDAGVRFSINCKSTGNSGTTEVIANEFSQRFSIYPNPTTGVINIDLGENNTAISTTVRNALGQVILTQHFENIDNISLDIDAPIGIYFLTLETELGESKTIKVIKE